MISLSTYIYNYINEGIFDKKPVDYLSFKVANQQLGLVNIDKDNIQDKSEIKQIYFNNNLKVDNGKTVKDNVNTNKAIFRKFRLDTLVVGSNTQELTKMIADFGDKIDTEIGTDTYTDKNGTVILRYYKDQRDKQYPMLLITFEE